jgi:hypothetical protein
MQPNTSFKVPRSEIIIKPSSTGNSYELIGAIHEAESTHGIEYNAWIRNLGGKGWTVLGLRDTRLRLKLPSCLTGMVMLVLCNRAVGVKQKRYIQEILEDTSLPIVSKSMQE